MTKITASGNTVVQHSTHNPKMKGLNPPLAPRDRYCHKVKINVTFTPKYIFNQNNLAYSLLDLPSQRV